MIEAALVYMAGFIAMILFAAVRTPNNEVGPVAVIALMWPVMLPFILLSMLLDVFGVVLDFDTVSKPFGFRKSPNPAVKGYAVTILFLELRVFKNRKA